MAGAAIGIGKPGEAGETRMPALRPGSVWTPSAVRARLRLMMIVLASDRRPGPSGQVTAALPVVRTFDDLVGVAPSSPIIRIAWASAVIDATNEATSWVAWLRAARAQDYELVMRRAARESWAKLERRFGRSERHLRRQETAAILALVVHLNAIP